MKNRIVLGVVLAAMSLVYSQSLFAEEAKPAVADPLPAWNDSASKRAIIDFVQRVTTPGGPDFVAVEDRVAVFDNDGTLSCEAPLPAQAAFAFDELTRLAPQHMDWEQDPLLAPAIKRDFAAMHAQGKPALLKMMSVTHAGMTTDEFKSRVANWSDKAEHPRFKRSYSECVYQPMIEVLLYFRANGFKTYVVSGGGVNFMRCWMEPVFGFPPEQLVGSVGRVKYELRDTGPVLVKTMDHLFIDDKEGKPAGIDQFIGRRPIAAFGNSDGDQAMLEYTTIKNPLPSLGVLLHHTDAKREYAYDAKPPSSGKLVTALEAAPQRGWTVIDMQADWKQVFSAEE